MTKPVKSVDVNFCVVFAVSGFLHVLLWILPFLLGKYVDITFPFVAREDITRELVGLVGVSGAGDLDWCPVTSPHLRESVQLMTNDLEAEDEADIVMTNHVLQGGVSKPTDCRSRYQVVLVVPYRNRSNHLQQFLTYMHPFLTRQQLHYRMVVVEQTGNAAFNRAKLFNIGFMESLKLDPAVECFIFHDVDLLPRHDHNIYACTHNPRHMYSAVDIFRYHLPYRDLAGGAVALQRIHFQNMDGFSNHFYGWGGEDDDLNTRIQHRLGLTLIRFDPAVASYVMLEHRSETPAQNRSTTLQQNKQSREKDGLSTLQYTLIEKEEKPLYTWLLVSC